MSERDLVLAGNPEFAAQLTAAGVQPIQNLVAQAQQENLDKVTKALVGDAVMIVTASDDKITNGLVDIAKLQKQIADKEAEIAATRRAKAYFNVTGNILPLREDIGIKTSKDSLALVPGCNKVPEDFVAA